MGKMKKEQIDQVLMNALRAIHHQGSSFPLSKQVIQHVLGLREIESMISQNENEIIYILLDADYRSQSIIDMWRYMTKAQRCSLLSFDESEIIEALSDASLNTVKYNDKDLTMERVKNALSMFILGMENASILYSKQTDDIFEQTSSLSIDDNFSIKIKGTKGKGSEVVSVEELAILFVLKRHLYKALVRFEIFKYLSTFIIPFIWIAFPYDWIITPIFLEILVIYMFGVSQNHVVSKLRESLKESIEALSHAMMYFISPSNQHNTRYSTWKIRSTMLMSIYIVLALKSWVFADIFQSLTPNLFVIDVPLYQFSDSDIHLLDSDKKKLANAFTAIDIEESNILFSSFVVSSLLSPWIFQFICNLVDRRSKRETKAKAIMTAKGVDLSVSSGLPPIMLLFYLMQLSQIYVLYDFIFPQFLISRFTLLVLSGYLYFEMTTVAFLALIPLSIFIDVFIFGRLCKGIARKIFPFDSSSQSRDLAEILVFSLRCVVFAITLMVLLWSYSASSLFYFAFVIVSTPNSLEILYHILTKTSSSTSFKRKLEYWKASFTERFVPS